VAGYGLDHRSSIPGTVRNFYFLGHVLSGLAAQPTFYPVALFRLLKRPKGEIAFKVV
jgi:hypothetical protein